MDRLVELGQLLDWYGGFLTPRQAALARQYAFEDCSLSEIAEREGVSRQAIRDAISRAQIELSQMEQQLSLIRRTAQTRAIADEIGSYTQDERIRGKLQELISLWEDDDGV